MRIKCFSDNRSNWHKFSISGSMPIWSCFFNFSDISSPFTLWNLSLNRWRKYNTCACNCKIYALALNFMTLTEHCLVPFTISQCRCWTILALIEIDSKNLAFLSIRPPPEFTNWAGYTHSLNLMNDLGGTWSILINFSRWVLHSAGVIWNIQTSSGSC